MKYEEGQWIRDAEIKEPLCHRFDPAENFTDTNTEWLEHVPEHGKVLIHGDTGHDWKLMMTREHGLVLSFGCCCYTLKFWTKHAQEIADHNWIGRVGSDESGRLEVQAVVDLCNKLFEEETYTEWVEIAEPEPLTDSELEDW